MGTRGTNTRNGKAIESAVAADSAEAAEEAGLQYVNDDRPGYSRKAKGKNFEYLDTEGKTIRDEQRLLRIKRLAIPPAWTEVWICPSSNGHIQATGRDARGRKQYRYHERWREVRDENKFDRLAQFAKALPNIRRRVTQDLKLPGLPRQKVLATIVRLLERTFIRVGNEEYARDNKSFGLTTLKNRHVKVKGAKVRVSVPRQERASTRSGCHRSQDCEGDCEMRGLTRPGFIPVPRGEWRSTRRYLARRKRVFTRNRR